MEELGNNAQECPTEEVHHAYRTGVLRHEDVERFERHFFGCDACWKEVQTALEVRAALTPTDARNQVSKHSQGGWSALLGVAAALALVVVGLWQLSPLQPSSSDILRGAVNTIELQITPRDAGTHIAWPAISSAVSYTVEIRSGGGELLYEQETKETSWVVSNEILANMETASFFVRVQALDSLRQVLASGLSEQRPPR